MSARARTMSIGQVLKEVQKEFPDVTVSKIRFLESAGLLDPGRTVAGYRQFSEADLHRLIAILRLQRDQFMPLKVIRQKLDSIHEVPAMGDPAAAASGEVSEGNGDEEWQVPETGVSLSLEELSSASGLDEDTVRELQEFGLLQAKSAADGEFFDEDDLMVARIARDFGKFGIEPRHLKMYRNFTERESGLFEQIVPRAGANRRSAQSIRDLVTLSMRLKHVLLRSLMREHLG